ncbi:pilus assembly protein [candidate division KSB1 bacterium]|nr:pilus assembly protein [candidate division KSB1 bacterium]
MNWILNTIKRLHRDEHGQAVVETAISILTFLMVVLGIMQMSLIFSAKFLTNYAAYCGARAAIISNNDMSQVRDAVAVALSPNYQGGAITGYLRSRIDFLNVQVQVNGGNIDNNAHFFDRSQMDKAVVTVEVTYWYTMFIPYVNRIIRVAAGSGGRYLLGHQIRLRSSYTMRMQSDNTFN